MEHSPGAEQVLRDFYHAVNTGDAAALDRLLSKQEVRVIGSDPAEWWGPDRDEVSRLFRGQVEQLAGQVTFRPTSPEAYGIGSVAWVADRPVVRLPDGSEFSSRFTAVVTLEGGEWKIVQSHYSLGVTNEESFGEELPTGGLTQRSDSSGRAR